MTNGEKGWLESFGLCSCQDFIMFRDCGRDHMTPNYFLNNVTSKGVSEKCVPGEPTTPLGRRSMQSSRWHPGRWWERTSVMTVRKQESNESNEDFIQIKLMTCYKRFVHAPFSWRQAALATGEGLLVWSRGRWGACGWSQARTSSEAGPPPPHPQPERRHQRTERGKGHQGYHQTNMQFWLNDYHIV